MSDGGDVNAYSSGVRPSSSIALTGRPLSSSHPASLTRRFSLKPSS